MTHNVHKIGPWLKTLAARVAEAKRGDVIVVADLEMMQYACFGIESRGFVTHDKAKGIVVHLAEGEAPTNVETRTMRGTGPSMQNIPRRSAEVTVVEGEAMQHVLGVGVVPGVPNANEDVFTEEAVKQAFAEHVAMPGPRRYTTIKPNDPPMYTLKDVAEGVHPLFDSFPPRWYSRCGTGRSLSKDYTTELPLSGFVVHAKAPSGSITVTLNDKPVPFADVPRETLRDIVAFANNPRYYLEMLETEKLAVEFHKHKARQTGKTSLLEHVRRVYEEGGLTVHPPRAEAPQMRAGDWAYGNLSSAPTKCSFNYALELLGKYDIACGVTRPTAEAVAELRKAFETQTALTISVEGVPGETLLVPPDRYAADQRFRCQACGTLYEYGPAKAAVEANAHKENVRGDAYHPETFCTMLHENNYLLKWRQYPPVGAEIPLGQPETCNLLDHYRASEGKVVDVGTGEAVGDVTTESYTTPADAMNVDKVAGFLGVEVAGPTEVVRQEVKKLSPEQIRLLRDAPKRFRSQQLGEDVEPPAAGGGELREV